MRINFEPMFAGSGGFLCDMCHGSGIIMTFPGPASPCPSCAPRYAEPQPTKDEQIATLTRRVAELEAIVKRLPRTADGVPIVAGDEVYWLARYGPKAGNILKMRVDSLESHDGQATITYGWDYDIGLHHEKVYSTEAAALAANTQPEPPHPTGNVATANP